MVRSLSFFFSRCDNGTESIGCGPQEEFRSCSDIAIHSADGEILSHSFEGEIVFVIITSLGSPLYQFYADCWIDHGKIPFGIEYNVRLLEIHTIQLFGHKSGHCERLFTTHMIGHITPATFRQVRFPTERRCFRRWQGHRVWIQLRLRLPGPEVSWC